MSTRDSVCRRARERERGAALTGVLVLTFALMAVAALAALSGYTNLLTASNLRAAAGAKADAENGINEAIYRLSLPPTDPSAIRPVLTDPDWTLSIFYTSGDTDPSDETISTIMNPLDWPPDHDIEVPAATMQFKKNDDGDIIFYDRSVTPGNPPFIEVGLPGPVGTLVGDVYELLCNVPSVLGLQIGGVLGLCEPHAIQTGYPVIQISGTGLDARGARRELIAEAARSIAFVPFAPVSAGGTVNLNSRGFIDGVNHDARIHLTATGGSGGIFGDENNETTANTALLGLLPLIQDSPDDLAIWTALNPLLVGPVMHGVANASLALYFASPYQSFPRLYNRQIANGNSTSSWVGVSTLTNAVVTPLNIPGGGGLAGLANIGMWTGMNFGYTAPIALSPTATLLNPPLPPAPASNNVVWNQGVFSWRINNRTVGPDPTQFWGAQAAVAPAVNTVVECGPAVQGLAPPLVCRPARLSPIPTFEDYLGIGEIGYASLIANPDTTAAELNLGQAPLGVTYVDGNFTLGVGTASPGTNQFGVMFVHGDLTVTGFHTFKGLIYVDGSITISSGAHLAVLGAIIARGGYTHVGTGTTTFLYSREATLAGIAHARPWRVLSWVDVAALQ